MENSYCGKNCGFCVTRTEGRCIGCKLNELHVSVEHSVYIPGVSPCEGNKLPDVPSDPAEASEQSTVPSYPGNAPEQPAISGEPVNTPYEQSRTRFSDFCSIAMCCRNKNLDGCVDCQKTFACPKYSQKGIMNTIIESKMEAWGMVDHGLIKAVPFLYILLACFLLGSVCDIPSIGLETPVIFLILSVIVSAVQGFAYFKLRSFNNSFLTAAALTAANIFARLFLKFLDVMNYGFVGSLLSVAAILIQLSSAILSCKISFDAYAELVSPVDFVLERRWGKLWRLTIAFYILALIIALINLKTMGISGFTLCITVASVLLNIITFVMMLFTIKACKKD